MDVQFLGLSLIALPAYFFLCMASLRYYVYRYKLNKDEVVAFLRKLKFPFTIILGDKPWVTITGDVDQITYLMDKKFVVEGRFLWVIIFSIIPIAGIYGTITAQNSLEGIQRFIVAFIYLVLLYFSAHFGHSLKPKAQK